MATFDGLVLGKHPKLSSDYPDEEITNVMVANRSCFSYTVEIDGHNAWSIYSPICPPGVDPIFLERPNHTSLDLDGNIGLGVWLRFYVQKDAYEIITSSKSAQTLSYDTCIRIFNQTEYIASERGLYIVLDIGKQDLPSSYILGSPLNHPVFGYIRDPDKLLKAFVKTLTNVTIRRLKFDTPAYREEEKFWCIWAEPKLKQALKAYTLENKKIRIVESSSSEASVLSENEERGVYSDDEDAARRQQNNFSRVSSPLSCVYSRISTPVIGQETVQVDATIGSHPYSGGNKKEEPSEVVDTDFFEVQAVVLMQSNTEKKKGFLIWNVWSPQFNNSSTDGVFYQSGTCVGKTGLKAGDWLSFRVPTTLRKVLGMGTFCLEQNMFVSFALPVIPTRKIERNIEMDITIEDVRTLKLEDGWIQHPLFGQFFDPKKMFLPVDAKSSHSVVLTVSRVRRVQTSSDKKWNIVNISTRTCQPDGLMEKIVSANQFTQISNTTGTGSRHIDESTLSTSQTSVTSKKEDNQAFRKEIPTAEPSLSLMPQTTPPENPTKIFHRFHVPDKNHNKTTSPSSVIHPSPVENIRNQTVSDIPKKKSADDICSTEDSQLTQAIVIRSNKSQNGSYECWDVWSPIAPTKMALFQYSITTKHSQLLHLIRGDWLLFRIPPYTKTDLLVFHESMFVSIIPTMFPMKYTNQHVHFAIPVDIGSENIQNGLINHSYFGPLNIGNKKLRKDASNIIIISTTRKDTYSMTGIIWQVIQVTVELPKSFLKAESSEVNFTEVQAVVLTEAKEKIEGFIIWIVFSPQFKNSSFDGVFYQSSNSADKITLKEGDWVCFHIPEIKFSAGKGSDPFHFDQNMFVATVPSVLPTRINGIYIEMDLDAENIKKQARYWWRDPILGNIFDPKNKYADTGDGPPESMLLTVSRVRNAVNKSSYHRYWNIVKVSSRALKVVSNKADDSNTDAPDLKKDQTTQSSTKTELGRIAQPIASNIVGAQVATDVSVTIDLPKKQYSLLTEHSKANTTTTAIYKKKEAKQNESTKFIGKKTAPQLPKIRNVRSLVLGKLMSSRNIYRYYIWLLDYHRVADIYVGMQSCINEYLDIGQLFYGSYDQKTNGKLFNGSYESPIKEELLIKLLVDPNLELLVTVELTGNKNEGHSVVKHKYLGLLIDRKDVLKDVSATTTRNVSVVVSYKPTNDNMSIWSIDRQSTYTASASTGQSECVQSVETVEKKLLNKFRKAMEKTSTKEVIQRHCTSSQFELIKKHYHML